MDFEAVSDPLATVDEFRAKAVAAGVHLPEAMTLATIGEDGRPKARVVLLKGRKKRALIFFTNYRSSKARELSINPHAALCFHYSTLQLQVRIEGKVRLLSSLESDEYFATRPRESQIGAWASQQSDALESRALLDEGYAREEARFANQDVPRPAHWGGMSLEAERVELWVGQGGRLHDRALYIYRDSAWTCQRLYP